VPGDIPDQEDEPPVRQRYHVVPVTADVGAARPREVAGRDLHPADGGHLLREQGVLQRLGHRPLLQVELTDLPGELFRALAAADQPLGQQPGRRGV